MKHIHRPVFAPPSGKQLYSRFNEPLFKNSFFLLVTNVLTSAGGFLFWALAANLYSGEDIGLASALVSAASLVSSLALMGLNFGVMRFLSSEHHKQTLVNTCLTLAFLSSSVFSLGFAVFSPPAGFFLPRDALTMFFIFTCSLSLCYVCGAAFIASRRAHFSFVRNLSMILAQLALLGCLAAPGYAHVSDNGYVGLLSCFSFAALFSLFVALYLLSKTFTPYRLFPGIDLRHLRYVFRLSVGNYLVENFSMLPRYILPIVVLVALGPDESAYFSVALTVSNLLFLVPAAVSNSLFAEGTYSHDRKVFSSNISRSLRLIALILVPMIVVLFAAGKLMLAGFGELYIRNTYVPLCIISLASLPYAVIRLYATVKNIQLDLGPVVRVSLFSAAASIILSVILLEAAGMGITGAALGFTLGQLGGAALAAALHKSGS